jgi:nitroreductase
MEFYDVIAKRYSVRAYQSAPVAQETLQRVLEAAALAPTAHNNQPFNLVVIHTAGREQELAQIYDRDWFYQAPLLVCAVGIPHRSWVHRSGKTYLDVDVAIVMDHLILAATAEGLGTCWVASFNIAAARQVLQLPPDVEPIVFTPLGYPAEEFKPHQRQPVLDLVRFEHW